MLGYVDVAWCRICDSEDGRLACILTNLLLPLQLPAVTFTLDILWEWTTCWYISARYCCFLLFDKCYDSTEPVINLEEPFAGDDRCEDQNLAVNGPGVECRYVGKVCSS